MSDVSREDGGCIHGSDPECCVVCCRVGEVSEPTESRLLAKAVVEKWQKLKENYGISHQAALVPLIAEAIDAARSRSAPPAVSPPAASEGAGEDVEKALGWHIGEILLAMPSTTRRSWTGLSPSGEARFRAGFAAGLRAGRGGGK